MSAATRIPVYIADVDNRCVARGSDDFFHKYSWQTPSLDLLRDFIGEALEHNPKALVTVCVVERYQREVDDLPTEYAHELSNKVKKERDR